MKKITKNKVQRMRNLVTGNYGDKTRTRVGYKKYKNKHEEGDVWEENGKKWTIKNGIKQSISKLNKAREINEIPMSCPKCGGAMNKSQHRFMYLHHGHCLFCQQKVVYKKHAEGTYNDWLIENAEKNFSSWKKDKRESFNRWLSDIDSKYYITEAGLIEDWEGLDLRTKNSIIEKFEEYIKKEENKKDLAIKQIGE